MSPLDVEMLNQAVFTTSRWMNSARIAKPRLLTSEFLMRALRAMPAVPDGSLHSLHF